MAFTVSILSPPISGACSASNLACATCPDSAYFISDPASCVAWTIWAVSADSAAFILACSSCADVSSE